MNYLLPITMLAMLFSYNKAAAQPTSTSKAANPVVAEASKERKLVWSDEFDKDGLPDAAKWGYEVGGKGWGNNELQHYTKSRPENARVENGNLIIEARKEPYEGNAYTSARLLTKNTATWTYGRFDIRAKIPAGRGTWPAIWMLGQNISSAGWPLCGEIDIMEHVGYDQGVVHGTIHSTAYNHNKGTQKGKQVPVPTASTDFHVYSVDWTSERMDFLVDGKVYHTLSKAELGSTTAEWPFVQPFFLILNVAVGGNWGGKEGVDETIWPRRMEVDYVRVYQ